MIAKARTGQYGRTLLILGLIILICAAEPSRTISDILNVPPTTFNISQGLNHMIGHGRYEFERPAKNEVRIHGEDRFQDGEYDIENDLLNLRPDGGWPSMISFQHDFYNTDGSLKIAGSADVTSGRATCIVNESGHKRHYTATLNFPADTYAGAALLVPIRLSLAGHKTSPIRIHAFTCAPKPPVVAVKVEVRAITHSGICGGKRLLQAEAKPDFGLWNFLVSPFVPKVQAWFDPADGFRYVGGRIHRYLTGPEKVTLISRNCDGPQ